MAFSSWIILNFLFCLELIREVSAVYCSYETSSGTIDHMFCLQKCCDAEDRYSTGSICCSYRQNHEVFIGAGMATLIVISVFAMCFLYICCKQKITRQSREYANRNPNSRIRPSRRTGSITNPDVLPTVSSQIEPVLPPPYMPPQYDALPPPYSQIGKDPEQKSKGDKSNSYEPPPEYSLHDVNSLP